MKNYIGISKYQLGCIVGESAKKGEILHIEFISEDKYIVRTEDRERIIYGNEIREYLNKNELRAWVGTIVEDTPRGMKFLRVCFDLP